MNQLVEVSFDINKVRLEWNYRKDWYVVVDVFSNNEMNIHGKFDKETFFFKDCLDQPKYLATYVKKFKERAYNNALAATTA